MLYKSKRMISILLCLAMVLAMVPVGASAAEIVGSGSCGDNATYTLDADGVLTISGSGAVYANEFKNRLTIEKVVVKPGITSIGEDAFYFCQYLTSVTLPEGLTSIGEEAFYDCINLTSVEIPQSVTTIEGSAFGSCDALQGIWVDPQNKYYASDDCGVLFNKDMTTLIQAPGGIMGSYAAPEGLTSIGSRAFYYCDSLTSVTLPEGLTSIGEYAFCGCDSLTSVTLPEGLTSIGEHAFYNCYSLTSATLPEGLTSIGEYAFFGCTSLSSVTLPEGLASIGGSAFAICTSLSSVTLPEGLTNIGVAAFASCDSLTSVEIPESVATIGVGAFNSCDVLQGIWVDPQNEYYVSDNLGVLFNKDMTTLIQVPGGIMGSYAAPEGLTSIGGCAFCGCDSLTGVTLPEGLTSIGGSAFAGCTSLTSVTLPEGLTSIGEYAFNFCTSLTSVTLPEGLTSIGDSAFRDCTSLTSVTLPEGLTSIGGYAFERCDGLEKVVFLGNAPAIYYCAFKDVTAVAYYPVDDPTWIEDVRQNYGGTISWVAVGDGVSRNDGDTKTKGYQILTNKKHNRADKDEYVLCTNAQAKNGGQTYPGNSMGVVELPGTLDGDVIFSAKGYVSRTLTAEQLATMKEVRLQKVSEDGPVISGLWIGDVDAMAEEVPIAMDDDTHYKLTAEVDWGTSGAGTVKLWQDGIEASFDGSGKLGLVIADRFDVLSKIYVIATDADGRTCKRVLKVQGSTLPGVLDYLDGMGVSFGESLSLTLPDSIPIFGGGSIAAKLPAKLPVTVSAKDGVIYCAVGVDLYERTSSDDWVKHKNGNVYHTLENETKGFVELLKRDVLSAKDMKQSLKGLKDIKKAYKKAITKKSGSFGFDADITVMGFLEGVYDKNGNITWLDTGMIVSPSIGLDWGFQTSIGPVPVYLEAALEAEITGRFNLFMSEKASQARAEGTLSGDISVRLGGGVGIRKVVTIGGGGRGTLSPYWAIRKDQEDYFKLTASLNLYAKATLGPFSYTKDFKNLAESVWIEYPSSKSAKTLAAAPGLYDMEGYELVDLSYLDQVSYVATTLEAAGQTMGLASVLKTNIYQQSEVQLQTLADGRTLAVWLDAEDSVHDHLQLYYSILDGSSWSAPALVCDDGTMDMAPQLARLGSDVYLTWQNADRALGSSATPEALAEAMQISVAKLSGSGFQTSSFGGQGLDMMPRLCANGSTVYAVWVHNDQNDWFGQGTNQILYSQLSGGTWSAPQTRYSGLGAIDSLTVDYDGGLHVAYCMDTDGDMDTVEDLRLYVDGKRYSSDEVTATAPVYVGHELYWYSEGSILCEGMAANDIFPTDRFQIVTDGDQTAVLFTQSQGLGNVLMVSYYDEEENCWTDPMAQTEPEYYISNFCGSFDEGMLQVLAAQRPVVGTEEDEDPYGLAELALYGVDRYYDLRLVDVTFDESTFNAGETMFFTLEVENNGTQVVDHYIVTLTDKNGNELTTIDHYSKIMPGQIRESVIGYEVPADVTGQQVRIRVSLPQEQAVRAADPEGQDVDPVNDEMVLTLAYENLRVENAGWAMLNDTQAVVSAEVVNRGYKTQSGVKVALRKGTVDGPVVQQITLPNIGPMELEPVDFVVDYAENTVYYIVITGGTQTEGFTQDDSLFVNMRSEDVEDVPCTEHDWMDANCTEPRTCRNCGETEGEVLGHDYVVTTGICSQCGDRAPFSVETPRMELCYGSTQVKVKAQWTKVSGVDGYELYMSTDPDDLESFALVKSVLDPNTLSYTKGSLTPGVTYYFRVCAFVFLEDGITRVRSSLSNVKYCMPTVLWDAPYSNSDFRIRLRWEPVEGADGFQIWRKGEGEDYRVVKTLKDGGADAYSNVSLKAGGTYTYKMRAYFINEDGSKSYGAYSDEITVGVQPSMPEITVKSTKAGRAQIGWDDLYGASAYQVWMSENPNGTFKIVKSIYDGDVTSYTKTGLVSGKTYYFKVRASVEIDGKKTFGAYSEVIAVTVK